MHFTKIEQRESRSGIPLSDLQDVGNVLNAIERVAGRSPRANANDVIATLQSGRTWTARFDHIQYYEFMTAYIQPCENRPFTVDFDQAPAACTLQLAQLLGRELGTSSIYLIADPPVTNGRQFTLDVERVFRILAHFGFVSKKIPSGDALAQSLARTAPNQLQHFFINAAAGIRVNVDDSSLGPLADTGRPLRSGGYGTILGPIDPLGRCCLKLGFADVSGSPAYGTIQQNLRYYALGVQKTLE